MKKEERLDTYIHYCMCAMGGFFGGYAILNRCEVFGSSQTANLINLMFDLLGRNLPEFLVHSGAAVLYVTALALAVVLAKRTKIHMRYFSIFIDFLAIVILCCLPEKMDPILALYPIFFATAMQWSVFGGAQGFNSSSIFSTNNVKQTVASATSYLCDKKKEDLVKAKFFGSVLLSYHFGVVLAYLGFRYLGIQGAVFGMIPLLLGTFFVFFTEGVLEERRRALEHF